MAGSWQHATTSDGKLIDNEDFVDMIENLGDAYEMAEEMVDMIWWLAAVVVPMGDRAQRLEWIRAAHEEYKTGLRDGGMEAQL